MQISQSAKLAGVIVLFVLGYFLIRSLFAPDAAIAPEETVEERFVVIAQPIEPQEWRDEIIIRGRTKALRKVTVRAEIQGVIARTPAESGARVSKGDVLCQLKIGARRAQLNEARAALSKARLDHEAAVRLNKEGFRAETSVAGVKATLDQARAGLEQAELSVSQTNINAPFDGVFDQRLAQAGDFLNIGGACGVVIQDTPFLVVGAVSEKDVSKISKGNRGLAQLATGETVEGTVRLVSTSANPRTRTFNVELEIPNQDGKLRDGVTAEFKIFAAQRQAYHVPRSSLTLNDHQVIGLRLLDENNRVMFAKIALLGEDRDGVWVRGLEGRPMLITRGQDYVAAGDIVDVAPPDEESPAP